MPFRLVGRIAPTRRINPPVFWITGGGLCDPDPPEMRSDPTRPVECGVSDHRRGGFDRPPATPTMSSPANDATNIGLSFVFRDAVRPRTCSNHTNGNAAGPGLEFAAEIASVLIENA